MAKIAKKVVSADSVTFEFANGKQVVATLEGLTPEIVNRLALHGLSQKVGDSYSSNEGPDDAVLKAQSAYDNLKQGDWNAKGSGIGSLLVRAVAKITGKEVEEVAALLDKMEDEKKKALQKRADVKLAMAELKMADLQSKASDAAPLEL